jgi:hypothetical protein
MTVTMEEAINTTTSMRQAAKAMNMAFTTFKRRAIKLGLYHTNQGLKGSTKPSSGNEGFPLIDILEGKHPQYQSNKLRIRLIREGYKDVRCECCENSEWMGKPISLEVDHINGISTDHRLENLKILCPNCHAQTSTYRGKNIKK